MGVGLGEEISDITVFKIQASEKLGFEDTIECIYIVRECTNTKGLTNH